MLREYSRFLRPLARRIESRLRYTPSLPLSYGEPSSATANITNAPGTKGHPLFFNADRVRAAAELHTRPFPKLTFPARIAHLVWMQNKGESDYRSFNFARLEVLVLCQH
jgi:hypothetical protein